MLQSFNASFNKTVHDVIICDVILISMISPPQSPANCAVRFPLRIPFPNSYVMFADAGGH